MVREFQPFFGDQRSQQILIMEEVVFEVVPLKVPEGIDSKKTISYNEYQEVKGACHAWFKFSRTTKI
jgi:hypothetical protein